MALSLLGDNNKVLAEYVITVLIVTTVTPLILIMLAFLYEPDGGLISAHGQRRAPGPIHEA